MDKCKCQLWQKVYFRALDVHVEKYCDTGQLIEGKIIKIEKKFLDGDDIHVLFKKGDKKVVSYFKYKDLYDYESLKELVDN